MASWFLLLTFCILHKESKLLSNFSERVQHLELYKVLTNIYRRGRFTEEIVIKMMNCILNLASNNDYFFLFEARLGLSNFSLREVIKQLSDETMKTVKYLDLVSEDFVYLLIKILFEWDLSIEFKLCYLKIISRILKHSYYNALSCGQGRLVEYLLICLRKESEESVKSLVAGILSRILRININVSQLKCLLRTVRINYHTLHQSFFEELISSPMLRKTFTNHMLDLSSYSKSVQIIFKKIIMKVLTK